MYKVAIVKVRSEGVAVELKTKDSQGLPHKVRSSTTRNTSLFRNDNYEFFMGDHADVAVRIPEHKAERLITCMFSDNKWNGGVRSVRKFLMSNIMK